MAANKWTAVAAFVCGAAVGVLAGMYIAPKSGEEMREDLSDRLSDTAKGLRAAGKSAARRAHEVADDVRKSAADVADAGVRAARKLNLS